MDPAVNDSSKIFSVYVGTEKFTDRFADHPTDGVDVIIPIIHTNELWSKNLHSIYREIPVKRLLIGDGGCIDDSIDIVRTWPRVEVLDHRNFVSLGFSIRKLIEAVTTDWFIYLHSDVYLPPGWFDEMAKHRSQYDWFECRQYITAFAEYPLDYTNLQRSLSGSQMGRRAAFDQVLPKIDDDYLYRNEDIIITDLVTKAGGTYGRVDSTFHYHQVMNKASAWKRKVAKIDIQVEKSPAEARRESDTMLKGLIKYTDPTPYLIETVGTVVANLEKEKTLNIKEYQDFARSTNQAWLPYLRRRPWHKRMLLAAGLKIWHVLIR